MRRGAEVARHLQREPGARGQRGQPARQQPQVRRHPLQHRVGDHHVGVRRRRPVDDVGLLGVDPRARGRRPPSPATSPARSPRRPASARRAAPVRWPGPQPRSTTRRGAVAPDPGQQVVERARAVVVEARGRAPGPSWWRSRLDRGLERLGAATVGGDEPAPTHAASSVPGSGRTCSTHAVPAGHLALHEPGPAAGQRRGGAGCGSTPRPGRAPPPAPGPASASRSRRGARSAISTAPVDRPPASGASITVSVPALPGRLADQVPADPAGSPRPARAATARAR